ncbi:MAG: Permease of the drug/metabolite transporter (DMT) superfamily [Firmicutes bacterium]|nr:Permease of the drug/metabolite transporter (DMT) superfamily [Bacillota bacterium]MDI6706275.1 DMT family transporter [Bacillota bacterium]
MIVPKQAVALTLALLGSIIMVWSPVSYINWVGVFLAFCSCLSFGTELIMLGSKFARKLDNVDSITVTTYLTTAATISLLLTGFLTGKFNVNVSPKGWLAILVTAVFSTVISNILFFMGLREIGSSRTSILSTLEPVVSVSLGVIVLRESLTLLQTLGISMIISAVLLIYSVKPKKEMLIQEE